MSSLLARAVLRLTRPERLARWRALEGSQWRLATEIRAIQDRRLAALLVHALARVPLHRGRGVASPDAAADPRGVLEALPRCDKESLTAAGGAALADDVDPARLVPMATGGSSGTPFRFKLDPAARETRYAHDYRTRGWAAWRPGDRLSQLWGHRTDVAQRERWQGRLRNALVNRTLTVNTFTLRPERLPAQLAALRRHGAPLIIGYASALAYFGRELRRRGQAPPRGLRAIISSAETLLPEARADIEAGFGCPVRDRYGSREFGVVAQQCEQGGGLHVSAEHVVLEILDPDGRPCVPGERGEIVLTDLDNRAMPFVRYRTGDLASWAASSCSCGRGLPLLAAVEGRVSDLLVARDGAVIACPGPTFFLQGMTSVKQLQIIQETREQVTLNVVAGDGWNDAEAARLQARMRELLGEIQVTVVLADEIPVTASGKYRFSLSRVSPYAN